MSNAEGAMRKLDAHLWQREVNEHYVEPEWCSARLFEEEPFTGLVHDPACGFGRIVASALAAGLSAHGSDIVVRSNLHAEPVDFLTWKGVTPNIVTNPPFNIADKFALHALTIVVSKVAIVFPTARLNAAHWLQGTPLRRVWMMTPRPSMPPGCVISHGVGLHGEPQKVGGGKMDYCWLVWERGHEGPAEIRWLRRDKPTPAAEQ